jgi:hypothetical protein
VPVPVIEPAPAPVVEPAPAPMPTPSVDTVRLEGVIQLTAPDAQRLEILGDDDNQTYTIKAGDADIILPGVDRAGAFSDFATGMRVRIVGERIDGGVIVADRIKIVPEETETPVAPVQPAVTDLSVYTGIIIDVRGSNISRSPSPAIYGPDMSLIYPDRNHVPTPDEVQDESIVRYYRSLDAAEAGVGGTHPLVLIAESVVGPAEDSVMLDATGAALFQALDKRLGYSKNWKVGFLVPEDK